MKILKFPDPILLTPCEAVTEFDEKLLNMLNEMWKTMKENRGIGLAANQVGIRLDMFVMETPSGRLYLTNPYISAQSIAPANLKEGCLSAPGESVVVPGRMEWVQVTYQNEKGVEMVVTLKGIYAVCAAHEIDHLDGKSFMSHKSLPKVLRKRFERKWGVK